MKAVIYSRDNDQPLGEIVLANGGNAVLKTSNKHVREFVQGLKVPDLNGAEGAMLTPKDGAKYIKALEIYGPTIQVEA
jgi:thiamine pyrophosphate-dependent acetolactate synthase large subunit-like protein